MSALSPTVDPGSPAAPSAPSAQVMHWASTPGGLPPTVDARVRDTALHVMAAEAPRVWAVGDATGDALALLRPARFTDLDAGRLGVSARPGVRRASWLATDIVTAFGCSEEVAGTGRPGETPNAVAAAWLTSHRITHLYVQFAWCMNTPALLGAVEVARAAGCHLWLVGDTGYTDHHREVLAPFDPVETTEVEFLHHFAHLTVTAAPGADPLLGQPGPGASPSSSHDAPKDAPADAAEEAGAAVSVHWSLTLPVDDFTTFRASCRDRLNPAQFAVLDAHYRAAHAAASRDLVPRLVGREDESRADYELRAADWFWQQWHETTSMQQFVVTVRAAQAAAFIAGHFVQVDFDQLLATANTTPRRTHRTRETWQRLRLYAHPYRSVPCVLVTAGMGVDDIAVLPVGSYNHQTAVVTGPDGKEHVVEDGAREYVETQVALRRLEGAGDDDFLLVSPVDGRPVAPRTIAANVRTVRLEVGLAVAIPAPERATQDSKFWTRRLGISIQELT